MLTRLHIRHLAVLDDVELELAPGFTVLTGETGAGKSMLVDALALALGERADSTTVRAGTERAEIAAVFAVASGSAADRWLSERDLESAGECQVRRIVSNEGRSRGYINGQPVPMEALRELGEQLFEICGQHAHQSLAQRATQRDILDAHGGHGALLEAVASLHGRWERLDSQRRTLLGEQGTRQARLDLIGYQLRELQALNLQPGEVQALEQERLLLTNAGRIASGLNTALERLYDAEQTSAHDGIGTALREVQSLVSFDPRLGAAAESLEQARILLDDAVEQIRRRCEDLEHDPARQDHVESRLATVVEVARKHRVLSEELWQHTERLSAEAAELAAGDSSLQAMALELRELEDALRKASADLHVARSGAAESLASAITKNLLALGMPGSSFSITVDSQPAGDIGPTGADQVSFMISTNAGQPAGPVVKVASGGELSRLSLAIHVVAMTSQGAPTLVFDEVDAGIGGGVAEIVGRSLKNLSARRQVLCVTHLPQVASQADEHFAVTKTVQGGSTQAAVRKLSPAERIDEIARMLGGVRITERTRDHAREMLRGARLRRAG